MTARVTTLKGPDAGAYYVEALPNYYLQSSEPRGLWHGRGAQVLGLSGEIADADFLALMAGEHPDRPGRALGRRYGDESVRGFDVTCSAPKSVSVLFAVGDDQTRTAVLDGHDQAVTAVVEWIERTALTRYRINGEVAVVDAEGIIAATFRQHTSRALDPQLHSHVVVANRVLSPDGRWLALDARGLKLDQRTVSAIYHASLQAELTRRLGVEWIETEHSISEIGGVPAEAITAFSQRTDSIRRRIDVKVDRFIDTMDREPTPRERWRLEREAVIDSRPTKTSGIDADELHAEWTERLEALDITVDQLERDCLGLETALRLHPEVAEAVVADAVLALEAAQSSWRPAELTREIARQLPANIGHGPTELLDLVENLTARAVEAHCVDISRPIPDGALVRSDGRPVSESVADRALTTQAILDQEQDVLAWAQRRFDYPGVDNAEVHAETSARLTSAQADVAAAIAGTGDLVLVVGPAGTGKTSALVPAVRELAIDRRHAFGVAPSATAAQVLETETGMTSDTIDKLLVEHDRRRPPGRVYDLPVGATVIVDEAGMVPTDKLAALASLSDRQGWRVALIGDPLQFSAVGRGGMFAHLIDTHGAIELDQAHRFTNEWERTASLRLRAGDQNIVDVYDQRGRIHGGTATRMETEALDAWATARRNRETVLLSAPSNETVRRLNVVAQQQRIDAGDINPRSPAVETQDYRVHMGDEIVTRRNDRQILTDQGHMVRNRDTWTVTNINRGAITATGESGTVKLPESYVSQHVELAYAQTSHATQGRTVDRSILVLDAPIDLRGLYVPFTRGRQTNDAYIAITANETAADIFRESMTRSWIDQPAHTRQAELADHRPGTIPTSDLRALFVERAEITDSLRDLDYNLPRLPQRIRTQQHVVDRTRNELDYCHGQLNEANDTLARLDRPVKRWGHRAEIHDAERLPDRFTDRAAKAQTEYDQATTELAGHRADLAAANELDRRRPGLEYRLDAIDRTLDGDANIRACALAAELPAAITRALGDRPIEPDALTAWDQAAGRLDQHQACYDASPFQRWDLPAEIDASAVRVRGSINALVDKLEPTRPTRHLSQDNGIGISM